MNGGFSMSNTYIRSPQDLVDNYSDIVRSVKESNRVLISQDGNEDLALISKEALAYIEEKLFFNYVNDKLREAEEWAAKPDAKWLSEDEFFERVENTYGI